MKHLRNVLIAALLLVGLSPAAAQLPNIQDKAVWGRVGSPLADGGSGPSQAIPFLNLQQQLGVHTLPEIYASDLAYGMKCDGATDDSSSLQLAVNAAATAANGTGAVVVLPAGTCEIYSNIWRNAINGPGILGTPGIQIRGQGRGVTILDSHVANDYVISVNPAWKAAHQAAFGATPSASGGALATNTYYLQITVNDNAGHEVAVTLPKSIPVTGATGSVSMTLPALNPGYSYNVYFDTATTPAHYALINGGNASAIGAGTVTITALGSAHTIPTGTMAGWQQVSIRDLSITNASGTANASGIEFFKVAYSDLTNIYMHGLTGDGFGIQAYTGDIDGSINVGIHNSKFDTIAGTCVNAAGNVLELSNFTVDGRTVFNLCGTAPPNIGTAVTVSAIPNNSSPIVTTSTGHNFHAADQIAFTVTGTTLASAYYRVGSTVTSNSFNLVDLNGVAVDTTSLGAFVSGTVALAWRPPLISGGVLTGGGGCLAWTGLIGIFKNLGFTQCNNFAMYLTEAGSNDNASIESVDFENTAGKGLYVASLIGGTLKNFECLSATAFGKTIACVQEGTGFAAGGVQNFLIDVGKVRSDVAPSTAFEQFQNTNIGATFQDTNRVRNITWQTFDAANQSRVNGFVNDPIPGNVQFSISASNTAKLIPLGYGGCLPLHLKALGEWICYHVAAAGVTGAVTGSLTPATSYNCYAYANNAVGFPVTVGFECNATATSIDKDGYSAKSTDTSRTFIGTATTDGSGNFQTAGAQTSWYPPTGASAPGNFSVGGNLTVVGTSTLNGVVTDGSGFLSTNIAAPSTPASGLDRIWTDSTDKRLHDKNDAGSIGTTVVADTGASNNFLTAISAAGAISKAQPSFSNLATGTATAFTLGGTVTGNSQNITGVATMSAATHAASGALTFQSNGSTNAGIINTSQQWGIGNTSPKTTLDVNANTSSSPALTVATSVARFQAADAVSGGFELATYGAGSSAGNIIAGFTSGGTAASPTGTANAAYMFNMRGYGYNSGAQLGGIWIILASEAWSAGHQGTQQQWYTTPNASTTVAQAMQLQASGGLSIGTTTDGGIGSLLANALVKSAGTTDATTTTTGALQSAGGLGVVKAIVAGTSILSVGPTAGIGYATGAGGAITQTTGRTTGVTLNTITGAITLVSAAGSATPASFTLTNSAIAATDVVKIVQKSGTDLYEIFVTNVAAGSCKITFFTTGGTTTEQPVLNFVVIKGVAS